MGAIKSQGSILKIETTRAAAKTITGITAASPPVVTATAHGYSNGDIVVITGVVGMVQVNDRCFQVASVTTDTFELEGVVGTGYTAYSSGGSAYKLTLGEVGRVANFSGFDGQSNEIDVTHLRSTAKEFLIGLQDFGNAQFSVQMDNADTGQDELRDAKADATARGFSLQLSDGSIATFLALVRQFTIDLGGPDNAVQSQISLRISGEPAWFV